MDMMRKIVIAAAMLAVGGCIYLGVSRYMNSMSADNVEIQRHCKYGKMWGGACKPKPMSQQDKNVAWGVGTFGLATAGDAAQDAIQGDKVNGDLYN